MKRINSLAIVAVLIAAVVLSGCSKAANTPKLSPEQAVVKAKEGTELVYSGKYAEANKALEEVAKSEQGDAKTYFMLGITRFQKKDYPGALEAYDKAIAMNPKFAAAYQGKGNIYRNQQNMKDAEAMYRKAMEVDPGFLDAYTELALQFQIAGRGADAHAVLDEGLKNNPGSSTLLLLKASFYKEAGKKDEAKKLLEQILKADPVNPDAKAFLADLDKK